MDERKEEMVAAGIQYEPPKVESVMAPEDLEREIQYAGIVSNPA